MTTEACRHRAEGSRRRIGAGALGEFWFDRGYWNEGREWLERALAAAGQIATYQPDYPVARKRLEESIALCRALGDTRGLAEALTYLSGALRFREGDLTGARRERRGWHWPEPWETRASSR